MASDRVMKRQIDRLCLMTIYTFDVRYSMSARKKDDTKFQIMCFSLLFVVT